MVTWQHMFSMPVMRTVWRRELESRTFQKSMIFRKSRCIWYKSAFTEPLKGFKISAQNFTKRIYSALLWPLPVSSLQLSRSAYLIRAVRNRVLIRKGRMGDEQRRWREKGEEDKERETAGDQIGKSEILVHLFPVSPPWSRNIPSSRCEGSTPAAAVTGSRTGPALIWDYDYPTIITYQTGFKMMSYS